MLRQLFSGVGNLRRGVRVSSLARSGPDPADPG